LVLFVSSPSLKEKDQVSPLTNMLLLIFIDVVMICYSEV
jgi:hypothetical protein